MLKTFRWIALLEGISYILLLFVAVPIKHLLDEPLLVRLLGMPHGLLFLAYVVLAIMISKELQWNSKTSIFILLASVIPFGTFVVDKKYFKGN